MNYTEEDEYYDEIDGDDYDRHLCYCPMLHDDFEEGVNVCGACGKKIHD